MTNYLMKIKKIEKMKDTKKDPCLCCPYHFDGYCHNCTHEGCEKEMSEKEIKENE